MDTGHHRLLLGWMGLTLLVTGARLWLVRCYRLAAPGAADAKRWGRRSAWGSGASGSCGVARAQHCSMEQMRPLSS